MENPDDLLSVYSTNDASEAEILKAALHGEGIKCEISGESQAGLTGISGLEIELLVRAEDFDRARAFLKQHHRGS
jgi:putative signal transducing protein